MSNLKNILFYSTQQGNVHVEVVYNNETFWLTQKAMALLFGVEVIAISKHLKNIFETKEFLEENSVVSKKGNNCQRLEKITIQLIIVSKLY